MSNSRRFSASKRNAHRANRSVREGSNGVSASTRQTPNKFSSAGVGVLDTYKGQFKDGAFNGSGTFTSKDGWTYEGNFVNGEPDGEGTLTTEDSIVYQGVFKQGIYQSAN